MAKKIILGLALALVIAGGAAAQQGASGGGTVKNWISGEASLLGAGVRYERMLNENWSIGANAYWSSFFIIWNEMEVGVSARYYPWGNIFFAGLGLGFHTHTGTYDYVDSGTTYTWFGTVTGAAITLEAGWKIDVGNTGKFFLCPGVKMPVTFGKLTPWWGDPDSGGFKVGFGVVPYFGLGYAF
jgi:hypothetical protein